MSEQFDAFGIGLSRFGLLEVCTGMIRRLHASRQLGISVRQIKYIVKVTVIIVRTIIYTSSNEHIIFPKPGINRQFGRLLYVDHHVGVSSVVRSFKTCSGLLCP